jgi:hypothetical protein
MRSIPVGSLLPCRGCHQSLSQQVCPFGSMTGTSAGHAVVPEEREPRIAPRSPPRHIRTSALAL